MATAKRKEDDNEAFNAKQNDEPNGQEAEHVGQIDAQLADQFVAVLNKYVKVIQRDQSE